MFLSANKLVFISPVSISCARFKLLRLFAFIVLLPRNKCLKRAKFCTVRIAWFSAWNSSQVTRAGVLYRTIARGTPDLTQRTQMSGKTQSRHIKNRNSPGTEFAHGRHPWAHISVRSRHTWILSWWKWIVVCGGDVWVGLASWHRVSTQLLFV